jgi:hypothetical protein
VLASAVGDLHHDKVALSGLRVKVALSTRVSIDVRLCDGPATHSAASGRRASTGRLIAGVVPVDRLTHRLNVDTK